VAAFEQAYLPWLKGREVGDIPSFIEGMFAAFRGPAEQAGAVGPLMSALCAVECALWDVAARRADVPLHRLLFDNPRPEVEIYASGINAPLPVDLIDSHLSQGVRLFKLKLGFGDDADRANLDALAKHLAGRARLAVDANRNWTLAQAERWLDVLADFDVVWLEEPLRAGEEESLERLFNQNKVPVAAGENVMMTPGGDTRVLADFPAHVLQPDLTK
jgi:L-alanine-DL-glutamate epimerase-like enolase superfamily enzyme